MNKTNLRIVSLVISLVLMISVCAIGSVQATTDGYEYHYIMLDHFEQIGYVAESHPIELYDMGVVYTHYDYNMSSPDYVVFEVRFTATSANVWFELDGYYIYGHDPSYDETPLTYYVIDCETKQVTPLLDALETSKDEYFPFLTDSEYEKIIQIGDINRDKVLDIKDATLIQKCLAEIENYETYDDEILGFQEKHHGKWERFVSDFNRDGERNIKDATAIQKHIAGLEY